MLRRIFNVFTEHFVMPCFSVQHSFHFEPEKGRIEIKIKLFTPQ